ncbi:hypothetical protein JHK84_050227 [Glycine max]|nr:hypothetical protein JHK85_050959 [Glycine max]KAG5094639.1 hypothetical protein JHK84_050227 [Glycine max]
MRKSSPLPFCDLPVCLAVAKVSLLMENASLLHATHRENYVPPCVIPFCGY